MVTAIQPGCPGGLRLSQFWAVVPSSQPHSALSGNITRSNYAPMTPGLAASSGFSFQAGLSGKLPQSRIPRLSGELVHGEASSRREALVREIGEAAGLSRSGRDIVGAMLLWLDVEKVQTADFGVTQLAELAGTSTDTVLRQMPRLEEAGFVRLLVKGQRGRRLQSSWVFVRPSKGTYREAMAACAEGRKPGHQRSISGRRRCSNALLQAGRPVQPAFDFSDNPQSAALREVFPSTPTESRENPQPFSHPHEAAETEAPEAPAGDGVLKRALKGSGASKAPLAPSKGLKGHQGGVLSQEQAIAKQALDRIGFDQQGIQRLLETLEATPSTAKVVSKVVQALADCGEGLLAAIEAEPALGGRVRNSRGILDYRLKHRRGWVIRQAELIRERQAALAAKQEAVRELLAETPCAQVLEAPLAAWIEAKRALPDPTDPGYLARFDAEREAFWALVAQVEEHLGEERINCLKSTLVADLESNGLRREGALWARAFKHHLAKRVLDAAGLANLGA